ncbi:hypothetical protein L7E62_003554 [Vibrio parahaemolyticus]|nr:hypothetical protein [Vibrio parahaemolyticus]
MYMFNHIDTYALNASKDKKAFGTVVKEFMREPGNCPHVPHPLPPKILYGVNAYVAEQMIKERVAKAKDKIGRKIRKDAQVALSGVVSFPRELRDESEEFYQSWVRKNIDHFKKKYGVNLISIIEHDDEEHPHLHYTVSVPESVINGECNIMFIHEPVKMRETTKGGRKKKYAAYKKAFIALQDEYFNEVAIHFGLLRTGPRRKRLTRKEYMTAKHEAKLVANAIHENEQRQKELTQQAKKIESKQDKLSTLEISVKKNAKQVIQKKEDLRKREAALNKKEENIATQEKILLTFLDENPESNKAKNFYSKTVRNLKLKLDEYINLFKEYRSKYNKLTVTHKNLEASHDKAKIENEKLKNENLKLKAALQIYKESATIVSNELEYSLCKK